MRRSVNFRLARHALDAVFSALFSHLGVFAIRLIAHDRQRPGEPHDLEFQAARPVPVTDATKITLPQNNVSTTLGDGGGRMRSVRTIGALAALIVMGCSSPDTVPPPADSGSPPPDSGSSNDSSTKLDTSKAPSCSGSPSACASLSTTQCTTVIGCSLGGTCTGVSSPCSYFNQFSCPDQQGCYWDSQAQYCTGLSYDCNTMTISTTCAMQQGCTWTPACKGTATASCNGTTQTACTNVPGCIWQ